MKTIIRSLTVAAGVALLCGPLQAQQADTNTVDDVRAYFEVLRSQYNTQKITVYNDVMKLNSAEADKFWPIYREYEKELAAVGDRKLELIREFFIDYKSDTLTDERSNAIAEKWLANVQERLDLWKKYHKKISATLTPARGAQFLQLENQMALFVDLAIASEMPAMPASGAKK